MGKDRGLLTLMLVTLVIAVAVVAVVVAGAIEDCGPDGDCDAESSPSGLVVVIG